MHAPSRHGNPTLTSLLKDDEVSCEVRPPRSPIRSVTLQLIAQFAFCKGTRNQNNDTVTYLIDSQMVNRTNVVFNVILITYKNFTKMTLKSNHRHYEFTA